MRKIITLLTFLISLISISACVSGNSDITIEQRYLAKADHYIYENQDSAEYYAGLVYSMSDRHSCQRIEAMNVLARIAFFKMDYVQSEEIFNSILKLSKDQLELLNTHIWLMKICQRISDNISFYSYRNDALLKMMSIAEESSSMLPEEQSRFIKLENDFRMVSALYYYELEQTAQADRELSFIEINEDFRNDTTRYLLYTYLRGMGVGISDDDKTESVLTRLRSFENCLRISARSDNLKMQAMATRGVVELLLEPGNSELFYRSGRNLLERLNSSDISEELLPTQLTLRSLQLFLKYGDTYDVICCYRLLASCYIEQQMYEEAIKYLTLSLDLLNDNRLYTYPYITDLSPLEPYRSDNEIVELSWLEKVPFATVPGCMSAIREQMSLAYSGLDNKVASDYNRNVYLELQKTLRLDPRYEARTMLLKKTNVKLNALLIAVIISILFFVCFFLFFERRIRRKNDQYIAKTRRIMNLCEDILRPLSTDGDPITELSSVVGPELSELLGTPDVKIVPKEDTFEYSLTPESKKLSKEDKTILKTITPYLTTAIRNANELLGQQDRRQQIIKQHYLFKLHAEENKKKNIDRKTCCSLVTECIPYIDRMKSEIEHLSNYIDNEETDSYRLQYISELATRINDYNEVLSSWIKVRQGVVNLNIESFPLQQLFDIVNKVRSSYRLKGITLSIDNTTAIVRADKVLTLFMINTLTDNAGKFTPKGGSINISATQTEEYVEIAVQDTGIGLSEEDVRKIEQEKVYDPNTIGQTSARKKGSGFGLMNCKGILEKYRKTDRMFDVCTLHVKSTPGQGSRFSFRLPKGIRRTLSVLLLLISSTAYSQESFEASDSLLKYAYDFAEKSYLSNIASLYDSALIYADSAIYYLNSDYCFHNEHADNILSLYNNSTPAETDWLQNGFMTDYETILWLRNEVAVSALALRDWNLYRYNDDAYLKLFKLYYGEDMIENDSKMLQRSNSNLSIAIILFITLLLIFLIIHYVVYSRHWLRYRSDLQQVLRVVNKISDSTLVSDSEHFELSKILQHIVDSIFDEINHLFPTNTILLAMEEDGQIIIAHHTSAIIDERLEERLQSCFHEQQVMYTLDRLCCAVPLFVSQEGTRQMVGVIGLRLDRAADETWQMTFEMITRYLASALNNYVLRLETGFRDIEQLQDESDRAKYEDGRLHVRNLILDNCLSTLKHETIYYPNRILQIATSIDHNTDSSQLNNLKTDMYELVSYYREIFGILSQHAVQQTGEVLIKTSNVSVNNLLTQAETYFKKSIGVRDIQLECIIAADDLQIVADEVMLSYLLENLLSNVCLQSSTKRLTLSAHSDGTFVRFSLENHNVHLTDEQLDKLFSPLNNRENMSYPICRQIIREHDEIFGHPGCRIVAEVTPEGYEIWFTILKK